jgi:hypothetical protein
VNPYVVIVGVNPAEIIPAGELDKVYADVGGFEPEGEITVYWQPEGDYELRPLIQETVPGLRDDLFQYMTTTLSARGGQEVAKIQWSRNL